MHFWQYLIALCSRAETANDVISSMFVGLIVCDKRVDFCNPRLNLSRENSTQSSHMRHFRPFFNYDNCQLEVASDIVSGLFVGPTGVEVHVKFCDSRSYVSRDM